MSFATLNGVAIVGGSLLVPRVGLWTADLRLATGDAETGTAAVTIGNLSLVGNIYRSDPFAGQTRARLVGGAGGWRKRLPTRAYGVPSGVSLRMILSDLATEAGEAVNLASDTTVGPFYARPGLPALDAPPASFTLRAFCPAWYVDVAGVTQIAAWPSTTVATDFTVVDQHPDEGVVTIATEDYASWLPGASFSSPTLAEALTCADVEFRFSEDGTARVVVMTSPDDTDRLLGPLNSVIARQTAGARFFGRYRYSVSNPTMATVDAAPLDTSIGLPSLRGVPLNSDSVAGYLPASGSECHVMFLDGKPTFPRIVWTAATATTVQIAGGSIPLALATLVDRAVSTIVSNFNTHTHGGVTTGTGSSSTPTPPIVPPPGSTAAQQVSGQ